MKNNPTIQQDFKYSPLDSIVCNNGDTYEDFKPLFESIEEYVAELGGSTKWVEETLVVYHKDFNKLNTTRVTTPAYIGFIEFTQEDFSEDTGIEVSFSDEVEGTISNFNDLKNSLKKFVTAKLPVEFYYTKEENELREAKTNHC